MKRLSFFLILMCLLPKMYADNFDDARHVLKWIRNEQGDSLVAQFHPDLRDGFPSAAIDQIWGQLEQHAGKYVEEGNWTSESRAPYFVEKCQLIFSKQKVSFTLLTDSAHLIVGFNFKPVDVPFGTSMGKITKVTDFEERDTFLVHGRIKLPATLCLPKKPKGKCPVIVLVHGLGPIDKDGSLGPNKPYREVARKFASKGIATLRYDKRSFVYGTRTRDFGSQMNYDTEVVDDAIEALDMAAHFPEIDAGKVYLLGHSLGGMLAPRVAMLSTTPLSGIIYVAGAARKLEDWLRSQFRYIAVLQNTDPQEADSLTHVIYSRLPESYRTFASEYNPVGTARGLDLPMLFLQGGHDFQVTDVDFQMWKQGLEGYANVQFLWLDNCDNLLREIPEMAVPEIYMRPGKISDKALDAITRFVFK